METKQAGLNDYRALFLIAFIILLVGLIPYGYLESSFSWVAFVTSGSLFMVALGMLLNVGQQNLELTKSLTTSKSKSVSKSSKKLVRKSTPKKSKKK